MTNATRRAARRWNYHKKFQPLDRFLNACGFLVSAASFELLLTRTRRANGGTIIMVRALLTSALIYALAIGFKHLIDPGRILDFSASELRLELLHSFQWYGAIFAGVYAALYARFSAQFTYLANVYNQIKQAEARAAEKDASELAIQKLREWKAGFIEDADTLHLATKPIFASVIRAWSADEKVKDCYAELTPGGRVRLRALLDDVSRSCEREEEKWRGDTLDQADQDQLPAPG